MTATQAPAVRDAAPRRQAAPAPRPVESKRPRLEVVGERQRTSTALAARRGLTIALMVIGGLFTIVVAHVVLTQNQFRLDRLESKAAEEQARYDRLRLEVARLEAPERIVADAQQRLGMVMPPAVRYVAPVAPEHPAPAGGTAADETAAAPVATARTWTEVKPHLAEQP